MAENFGKIVICDRCGKEQFLKLVNTIPRELDGGFTKWIDINCEPSNWEKCFFGTEISTSYDLCPACFEAFVNNKERFLGGEK